MDANITYLGNARDFKTRHFVLRVPLFGWLACGLACCLDKGHIYDQFYVASTMFNGQTIESRACTLHTCTLHVGL
jgi:hypothetical protein